MWRGRAVAAWVERGCTLRQREGFSLSYTSWAYSNLTVSSATIAACDSVAVRFSVRNTGAVASDEVAQLYLARADGTGDTNWPELRGFERLHSVAAGGGSASVELLVDAAARSSVRSDGVRVLRPGKYVLYVGGGQPLNDPKFHTSNILSQELEVTGEEEVEVDSCQ